MAVSIKNEPIHGTSPLEINTGVNAMDDDKEKSFAFQQSLLLKKARAKEAHDVEASIQNVSRLP